MTPPEIRDADLAWLARLAHSLVHEPHAADDLVQDTVLAAAQAPRAIQRPRAFLATIARRLAARRARSDARRSRRERWAAVDEQMPASGELVARAELAEKVARAARSLDEPFRTTVLAHYLDGVPIEEIARREERPADTVRWRLRRGLELLRAQLAREEGGDWPTWSVLLMPLARAHERTARGLTATAASAGSATTALTILMKTNGLLAAAALLLVAAAGAFLRRDALSPPAPPTSANAADESTENPVARPPNPIAVGLTDAPEGTDPPLLRNALVADAPTPDGASWAVRVVDPEGEPITGAEVRLVEVAPASDQEDARPRILQRSSRPSGADGIARFEPPTDAARVGIVVSADGWLRAALAPPTALTQDPAGILSVVLARGQELRGRVVDLRGMPVPGLDILAFTAGQGVQHVSLSSIVLRADDRFRDPRNAEFQSARATTAADGAVTLAGLPPRAELRIRSDDPSWRLVDPRVVSGDAGFVTFTAAPAAGLVVRVLDWARRPVPASATFRVDLDLRDGSRRDVGQWVGKGRGSLRFSFHEELFPELSQLDVVRATFHGTVTTSAGTESWRADPIQDPARGGLAVCEVFVSPPATSDETPPASTPTLPLVLDVLGGDGQPFTDPLVVSWSSDTRTDRRRGDLIVRTERPGIYRTAVPVPTDVETLDLAIEPRQASGSLPPWTRSVPARADRPQLLSVRLEPAGSVVVLRPARWSNAWSVRASYRETPDAPWQGSWTYGTRADRLELNALLPATWRFELQQEAPAQSDTLIIQVEAGVRRIVGG